MTELEKENKELKAGKDINVFTDNTETFKNALNRITELEVQIEKMKCLNNEWHKVADGDIPKNERWVCNQDGCYCYYDIDTEQWLDIEGTRTRTIEWCDMPKFKE